MIHSLRARLIISHTFLVFLALLIVGAGVFFVLRDYREAVLTNRLDVALRPSVTVAQDLVKRGDSPQEIVAAIQDRVRPEWHVFLVNDQAEIVADSKNAWVGRRLVGTAPLRLAGSTLFYASANLSPAGATRQFLVLASIDNLWLSGVEELALPLAAAGFIALFISLLVALVLARSISEPLQHLSRAAAEIEKGNYIQEIPVRGHDEVSQLATRFNKMAHAVQAAQQMQKDFVANISHELKTPLTSIQGFAQAIAEGATRDLESAQNAARLIFEESQRMGQLVSELMILARLEAGSAAKIREPVQLGQVLPVWVERLRPRAEAAQVHLSLAMEPLPVIRADAAQLEQIVVNLVDNAIKYNRRGGTVTVSAQSVNAPPAPGDGLRRRVIGVSGNGSDPAGSWVMLRVADTGQGIPREHMPRLFERFYRADKARVSGGTGLGLSIVREIVNAHHGSIQVDSDPGRGSTFAVWLPVHAP